jgi:3-oxoacyl-ACP reductase-like protein
MWKTMSRWKGNIKLGLKEIGWVRGTEWMNVIYESHQERSVIDIFGFLKTWRKS